MDAESPPPRPVKPIGFGLVLIGSELVSFSLVGIAADYFAGTKGGFTAGATLLGMVAAVALTVRLLREDERGQGQ